MRIEISPINGDRYTLSDGDTREAFIEADAANHADAIAAASEYDRWCAEARASDPRHDNDAVILADAMRHLDTARRLEPPVKDGSSYFDSRWSSWAASYYEEASKFTTCRDVLHFAQQKIPFDHRTNVKDNKALLPVYDKLLSSEFPFRLETQLKLSDNPKSIPETLYKISGRMVSNVFYWHMHVMFRCMECIPSLDRILEIGGGYGSLARLWLHSGVPKRYFIVDLPESLFFSEVCLRAEFGDDIGYWEGHDPGTRVVLVPVGRLMEFAQRADLVINVGSMQEMSDAWVGFYMRWLDAYEPKFFYSLNYVGQPIVTMYESRTFWAPRPSARWATRLMNPDVPLVKMMCAGRHFVEAIYERATPQQKFSDWSVLKGAVFTRATYLEGLELLRQDTSVENATTLIHHIIGNDNAKKLPCPKETMFLAHFVLTATGDPKLKKLIEVLGGARKEGTH